MKVLSAQQMRTLEQKAVDKGATYFLLMKKAGIAVAEILIDSFNVSRREKVCILCGKGNNGGDGFIAASYLKSKEFDVEIILVDDEASTLDSKAAYANAVNNKVAVWRLWEEENRVYEKIEECDYIIDAIYGIGFKGELSSNLNALANNISVTNKKVLSVDIPSGIECDTGKVHNGAFVADITVSFTTYKPAHLLYPSMDYCGRVILAQVGIDISLVNISPYEFKTIEDEDVYSKLPIRKISSHKGTFGTLLTICGSYGMSGAAVMSIKSALLTGVGLVKSVVPNDIYNIVATNLVQPVFIPLDTKETGRFTVDNAQSVIEEFKNSSAVLLGCGISNEEKTNQFVYELLKNIEVPIVIDADGINAISKHIDILKELKSSKIIITPHPAELARLCNVDVLEIQNNRVKYAKLVAKEHNIIVVLKGAKTVIANCNGEIFINVTGNAGMAKAGSGDVLAGMIASFVAQGVDMYSAAKCGVYLHGLAGDVVKKTKGEISMQPTDVIDVLPDILK